MFGSRLVQAVLNLGEKLHGLPGCRDRASERMHGLMAFEAKIWGLKRLRNHPNGILLEENQPGDYLGDRMKADIDHIDPAPAEFVERVEQLDKNFEQDRRDTGLRLISKRERCSHNSCTHNVKAFVKGGRNTNYLYIHPDDARQLQEGDMVTVSANGHCIRVPVKYDSDFMPGTVSIEPISGMSQLNGIPVEVAAGSPAQTG